MLATEYDELDRELGGLDDERGAKARGGGSGLRILPIVVGVVSLLALGGIIWYAYTQGVREGSEDAAPLLRPDGQAKAEPDDPGGRVVAGTDMGIYDCVNGDCDTTPQNAEIILPRPEEPLAPPTAPPPTVQPTPPTPPAQTVQVTPPAETAPVVEATTRAPVPAPELPDNLSVPDASPPTAGTQTQEVAANTATAPEPEVPPAVTPPPATPPATTPPPAQTASAAGAGWRIQLAALGSDAAARSQWTKLQSANSDLLGALALEVQQATVNGKQYFRVRGGPLASKDAAKALCAQLKAKNIACIPVAPGN